MPNTARTFKGLALAPAAPVGLAIVSCLLYAASAGAGTFRDLLETALGMALPVSYSACFVAGSPMHLILRRLGWTSPKAYSVAGALVTLPLALLVFANTEFPRYAASVKPPLLPEFLPILNVAVDGPLAALAFWRIARPDLPAHRMVARRARRMRTLGAILVAYLAIGFIWGVAALITPTTHPFSDRVFFFGLAVVAWPIEFGFVFVMPLFCWLTPYACL
jgi:hypothetical protein